MAAVDQSGRLVAILVPRGPGQWGAAKNFDFAEEQISKPE